MPGQRVCLHLVMQYAQNLADHKLGRWEEERRKYAKSESPGLYVFRVWVVVKPRQRKEEGETPRSWDPWCGRTTDNGTVDIPGHERQTSG